MTDLDLYRCTCLLFGVGCGLLRTQWRDAIKERHTKWREMERCHKRTKYEILESIKCADRLEWNMIGFYLAITEE